MRRYKRRDNGSHEHVRFWIANGCSWLDLGNVGGGCPDGLLGLNGRSCFAELKDRKAAAKSPRPVKLTGDKLLDSVNAARRAGLTAGAARSAQAQALWAERWRGCPVYQVDSREAAVAVLGALAKG